MHSRTSSIIFLAGLLGLVLAVGSAMAQSNVTLTAEVPFEFVAWKNVMPAGEYTVQFLASSPTLAIANASRTAKAVVLTNAVEADQPAQQPKLVFRKYGDRYFLAQIWIDGVARGNELPVSRTEREWAQRAAQPQLVAVLARR